MVGGLAVSSILGAFMTHSLAGALAVLGQVHERQWAAANCLPCVPLWGPLRGATRVRLPSPILWHSPGSTSRCTASALKRHLEFIGRVCIWCAAGHAPSQLLIIIATAQHSPLVWLSCSQHSRRLRMLGSMPQHAQHESQHAA